MKVLVVSGTPGTGKTTIAKKLAKELEYEYIDVNQVIDSLNLSDGYDKQRDTKVVDIKKLNKSLIDLIKSKKGKGLIMDSHLAHYLPKKYVTECIITKCTLKTLQHRLELRGYSKTKIRENLDAEIFDTCRIEALETGHKVKLVYTD